MKEVETDVLIVGSGGAGIRAAIAAHDAGAEVTVLSKSLPKKSHTTMAEGGFAAPLGNANPADDWKVHASDTLRDGIFINDRRMVEILAKEATDAVRELEEWGALFDRNEDGDIRQRAFGGHSYKRTCHVADQTGLEMVQVLASQAKKRGIGFMGEVFVITLFVDGGRVVGAFGLDLQDGTFLVFEAGAVVLATGGNARIFKRTTNPWETTGDGYAMAYRAGAALMDLEMVQFHPTGMVFPPTAEGVLVTESVRGEGGKLYNTENERFMERYNAKWMEIAPRDEVARAIWQEVDEGRGTENDAVYLDITHKDADTVRERLRGTYEQFQDFAGLDITEGRMEVAPTTHYTMGGVAVEAETGATTTPGLYAAGEVAAGVHGANRLGSNSLPDLIVFGRRAGNAAADFALRKKRPGVDEQDVAAERERVAAPMEQPGDVKPQDVKRELREVMWDNVGVWRTHDGLKAAEKRLQELKQRAQDLGVAGGLTYNQELMDAVDVHTMLLVAGLTLQAVRRRTESRGAHYRVDHPERDDASWLANIVVEPGDDGPRLQKQEIEEKKPEWYRETGHTALDEEDAS